MKTLLFGLVCIPLLAQTPTISNIVVSHIDHTSANISYTVAPDSVCFIEWGIATGVYPNAGLSVESQGGQCSQTLSGLAPNTTYYVLPTARPGLNSTSNQCLNSGCGTGEVNFLTSALPSPHPALPTPPTIASLSEPNVSGYTTVSIVAATTLPTNPSGGAIGDCVAASNVTAPGGGHWLGNVTANDTLTQIVGEIWYDVLLEFPESSTCYIPVSGFFNQGIELPVYSPARGSSNDWVIFQTHDNSAGGGDLPAFGMRTGPQYASKLATLKAKTPGLPTPGTTCNAPFNLNCNTVTLTPQFFDCFQTDCNGFWWRNLEFDHDYNSTLYPTGVVDPYVFMNYIRFEPVVGASSLPLTTTPHDLVIDRIYVPGQPYPAREGSCFAPGGVRWWIINSYCKTNFQTVGITPVAPPTTSGTTITVPVATFNLNAFDGHPLGTTGVTTITCVGAGCPAYAGNYEAWLDSGGLTFEYSTQTSVSFTCSGGPSTCVGVMTPSSFDIPRASMFYFSGSYGSGSTNLQYAINGNIVDNGAPSMFYNVSSILPLGIYWYDTQGGVFDNNFIQASGQTVYNDAVLVNTDLSWTHSYFSFPISYMANTSSWDGYLRASRNVIETKSQIRGQYVGNILSGSQNSITAGGVIYMASTYPGNGVTDINISGNVFKHVASGFACAGYAVGAQGFDSTQGTRIATVNNFFLDGNFSIYSSDVPGTHSFVSGWMGNYPGCSDLTLANNTVGNFLGPGPSFLFIGGNGLCVGLADGLNVHNNLATVSLGQVFDAIYSINGSTAMGLCSGGTPSNFVTSPYAVPGIGAPATNGTWKTYLDGDYIHYNNGTNLPSWNMYSNIILGGFTNQGGSGYTNLSPSNIGTLLGPSGPWPSPDTTTVFPCSSGDPFNASCTGGGTTYSSRAASIGWNSAKITASTPSGNPHDYPSAINVWNPATVGADVAIVDQATGTVNNIVLTTDATDIMVAYVAPDSRACSVRLSPHSAGTWTRMTDSGGAFSRSLTFGSLTASTSYDWNLECYSDQSAAFEYLPSQITSGMISTTASSTRTVITTFTLPATATKAIISFQGLAGSPVSGTYTSSPASTASVPVGNVSRTITYQTSGSVNVGSPSTTTVKIN